MKIRRWKKRKVKENGGGKYMGWKDGWMDGWMDR